MKTFKHARMDEFYHLGKKKNKSEAERNDVPNERIMPDRMSDRIESHHPERGVVRTIWDTLKEETDYHDFDHQRAFEKVLDRIDANKGRG